MRSGQRRPLEYGVGYQAAVRDVRRIDAYVELQGRYGCRRETTRASSPAEETFIFLKTVRRWLSTVRTLMSSAVAMAFEPSDRDSLF